MRGLLLSNVFNLLHFSVRSKLCHVYEEEVNRAAYFLIACDINSELV